MSEPRCLVVSEVEPGSYCITVGDRFVVHADAGEALWCIRRWLTGSTTERLPYSTKMETIFEMQERIRAEVEGALRPADRVLLAARRTQL